jgi:hypothetical protein
MKERYYKGLYLVSSFYDIILGFGFLLFYEFIYSILGMNLPTNPSYLSMCAMLIGIYGILLFMIYQDPKNSRKMIIYASLIKFGFSIVVLYYLLFVGTEYIDVPFMILGVIDLIFGLLFLESLNFAKK